jgi:hypothetical protein
LTDDSFAVPGWTFAIRHFSAALLAISLTGITARQRCPTHIPKL